MNRKSYIGLAVALLVLVPGIAFTEEPAYTSGESTSAQYLTSKERLLDNLAHTNVAIQKGDKEGAKGRLDQAMKQAKNIKPEIKQECKMDANGLCLKDMVNLDKSRQGMPVIDVEYKDGKATANLLIPVKDHQVTAESIDRSIKSAISDKAEITDAKLAYVAPTINKEALVENLQEAKQELNGNDAASASKTLEKAQDILVVEDAASAPPIQNAKDNIALARTMIGKEAFDSAGAAVKEADESLNKMEKKSVTAEQKQKVQKARAELASISEVIKRKDPSLLDKTDDRLKKWWEELSTWTKEAFDLSSAEQ